MVYTATEGHVETRFDVIVEWGRKEVPLNTPFGCITQLSYMRRYSRRCRIRSHHLFKISAGEDFRNCTWIRFNGGKSSELHGGTECIWKYVLTGIYFGDLNLNLIDSNLRGLGVRKEGKQGYWHWISSRSLTSFLSKSTRINLNLFIATLKIVPGQLL